MLEQSQNNITKTAKFSWRNTTKTSYYNQNAHTKLYSPTCPLALSNPYMTKNGHCLTTPSQINQEIYRYGTKCFCPTTIACFITTHPQHCSCNIEKFPWHDFDGYVSNYKGNPTQRSPPSSIGKSMIFAYTLSPPPKA